MTRMYTFCGILAALALAFGLFGWRMHSRGWDSATDHYKAVVASALAANATQAKTIEALKAANAQWADAAKASAAQAAQAEADVAATRAKDAQALAEAQAKLKRVVYASHPALVWGLTRVPTGVADQLRQ